MPDLLGDRDVLDGLSVVGRAALRDGVIGPDFGLVTTATPLRRRPGALGGPALMMRMPQLASWTRTSAPSRPATGFGFDAAELLGSATGEVIERYSASIVPDPLPVVAERTELDEWVPFTAAQYARPGFSFVDPHDLDDVSWTRAWDPSTGDEVGVPADLVYLACSSERQWCTITSSGLAAGRTAGAAARAAVFELVERDAFFRCWYGAASHDTMSLDELIASSDAERVLGHRALRMARRLRHGGIRVTFVRMPGELGVPVVLACARSSRVGLAIGCSAKPTVAAAVRSALIEASQTHDWASVLVTDGSASESASESVDELEDHVAYHASLDRRPQNAFLDAGAPQPVSGFLDGTEISLGNVIDRAAAAGWPLYLADVASSDVRAAGWHVIRALSPRAATLDVGPVHEAQHPVIRHRVPHPFP